MYDSYVKAVYLRRYIEFKVASTIGFTMEIFEWEKFSWNVLNRLHHNDDILNVCQSICIFFSIFTFSKASLSNQRKYAFATIVISLIDRRSVHNISMDVRNFYSSKCRDMIFYIIIIIIILYLEGDIKDKRYRVARRIQDGKKKKKKIETGSTEQKMEDILTKLRF